MPRALEKHEAPLTAVYWVNPSGFTEAQEGARNALVMFEGTPEQALLLGVFEQTSETPEGAILKHRALLWRQQTEGKLGHAAFATPETVLRMKLVPYVLYRLRLEAVHAHPARPHPGGAGTE